MDSSGNLYGTTAKGRRQRPSGDGTVFELLPHTPALTGTRPAPSPTARPSSSTQLDASATDSVTGAAVAGTFVYTPAAGTILHVGSQTLSVTFTPTDTTDYSPITTECGARRQSGHPGAYLEHSRPHYLRHAPEQHATGCHRCRSEYRISL